MIIGSTISHYRIVEKLAESGMGVVYKAHDTKLKRTVALKFLAGHLRHDAEAKQRFLREAQAAAAQHNPNGCPVYEIDEVDGKAFISMAFFEGESLAERGDLSPQDAREQGTARIADEYIELIKRCLLNSIYRDSAWTRPDETEPFSRQRREEGRDWPTVAHTMIGSRRLDNLHRCVDDVLTGKIPGDFIETGVWRGGATILMRAVLKARAVRNRTVWVADSFAGVPPPDAGRYPADAGLDLYRAEQLSVPVDEVQSNFEAYGLYDDQVRFLKGWFKDTLSTAPIERLAVMRLDGDLYESTMDALAALYPKLSIGGYVIIDDYGAIEACRRAVQDYRESHEIREEIVSIDWAGAFWKKRTDPAGQPPGSYQAPAGAT